MADDSHDEVSRATILRFAAETGLDPRTAKKAILRGADALLSGADRERARAASKKLNIKLGR